MWLDEKEMSEWALKECLNGNDTKEIRKLITTQRCMFKYCMEIKNRKEFSNKINHWKQQKEIYYFQIKLSRLGKRITKMNLDNEDELIRRLLLRSSKFLLEELASKLSRHDRGTKRQLVNYIMEKL